MSNNRSNPLPLHPEIVLEIIALLDCFSLIRFSRVSAYLLALVDFYAANCLKEMAREIQHIKPDMYQQMIAAIEQNDFNNKSIRHLYLRLKALEDDRYYDIALAELYIVLGWPIRDIAAWYVIDDNLEKFLQVVPDKYDVGRKYLTIALAFNSVKVAKHIINFFELPDLNKHIDSYFNFAYFSGNMQLVAELKKLVDEKKIEIPWPERFSFCCAVRSGSLDMVRYLTQQTSNQIQCLMNKIGNHYNVKVTFPDILPEPNFLPWELDKIRLSDDADGASEFSELLVNRYAIWSRNPAMLENIATWATKHFFKGCENFSVITDDGIREAERLTNPTMLSKAKVFYLEAYLKKSSNYTRWEIVWEIIRNMATKEKEKLRFLPDLFAAIYLSTNIPNPERKQAIFYGAIFFAIALLDKMTCNTSSTLFDPIFDETKTRLNHYLFAANNRVSFTDKDKACCLYELKCWFETISDDDFYKSRLGNKFLLMQRLQNVLQSIAVESEDCRAYNCTSLA